MADGRVGGQLVLVGAALPAPGGSGVWSNRSRAALVGADVVVTGDEAMLERAAADLDVAIGGRLVLVGDADFRLIDELIGQARQGASVALVSGAEVPPGVGQRLVVAAYEAGVPVTVVPGPGPVTAALAVSGLPAERFRVEARLPRAASERRARLAALATEQRTTVLLEQAGRLPGTVADLREALGADRPAVLCVRPTVPGGPVHRGNLAALVDLAVAAAGELAAPPGGEVALVVAGAPAAAGQPLDPAALRAAVAARVAAGQSHRDAVAAIARERGLRRREVYQAALDRG